MPSRTPRAGRSTCSCRTPRPSTSRAATWRSGERRWRRSAASTRSSGPPATTSTSAGGSRRPGWRIGFNPAAVVWHHRRPSRPRVLAPAARLRPGRGAARAQVARAVQRARPRQLVRGACTATPCCGRISRARRAHLPRHLGLGAVPVALPAARRACSSALPLMPEWYLVIALLTAPRALGLGLGAAARRRFRSPRWRCSTTVGGAVAQGLPNALRRSLAAASSGRCRLLTSLLIVAQPLARLSGTDRLRPRPVAARAHVGFVLPVPAGDARSGARSGAIRRSGSHDVERGAADDGRRRRARRRPFDRWDLEARGGLFGSARVLFAVEDHGAGTQYVRARVQPRWPAWCIVVLAALAALTAGAFVDGAPDRGRRARRVASVGVAGVMAEGGGRCLRRGLGCARRHSGTRRTGRTCVAGAPDSGSARSCTAEPRRPSSMRTYRRATPASTGACCGEARAYWRHIGCAALLLGLLATPLALLTPLPLKIAVDNVLGEEPLPRLPRLLVPDRSDRVESGPARARRRRSSCWSPCSSQVQQLASVEHRRPTRARSCCSASAPRLFRHASGSRSPTTTRRGTSDTTYRIQYDANAIQYVSVYGLTPLVTAGFMLLGHVRTSTARIDWQLALVALAITPVLLVLIARLPRPPARRAGTRRKELEAPSLAVVHETLTGLRVVKAFGQEEREHDRYVERPRTGERLGARPRWRHAGRFELLIGLVFALGTATVLYVGVPARPGGDAHARQPAARDGLPHAALRAAPHDLAQHRDAAGVARQRRARLQRARPGARRDRAAVRSTAPARPRRRSCSRTCRSPTSRRGRCSHDVSFEVPAGTALGIAGTTGLGQDDDRRTC